MRGILKQIHSFSIITKFWNCALPCLLIAFVRWILIQCGEKEFKVKFRQQNLDALQYTDLKGQEKAL